MSPWLLLGAVLAVAAAFGTGYLSGGRHERQAAQARERAAMVAEIQASNNRAEADHARSVVAEAARVASRRAQVERSVRMEERIRTEVVYRDAECRLDDESIRLLNTSIAGDSGSTASSGSDGRVQPALPASRPEPSGAAAQVP